MRPLILITFLCFLFPVDCHSQSLPGNFNLIPNAGFEFNTSYRIINDTDFINNEVCWAKANAYSFGFTRNATLYSRPHSGATFTALITGYPRYNTSTHQWTDTGYQLRTYCQSRLFEPLIAGKTYYFEVYAGAATIQGFDVLGNIGVLFSNNKVNDYANGGRINRNPQIRFTHWTLPVTDSFSWVKLSAAYTATGGERYLTIGNFDTAAQLHHVYLSDTSIARGYSQFTYNNLFIDDISLVSDTSRSKISLSEFSLGSDTTICTGQRIITGGQPYYFHYWWNTGDTSRFLTIDTPGTYWCTVDYGCGTYTDTINITTIGDAVAFNLPDTVLCAGKTLNVAAPTGNYTYHWSTGAAAGSILLSNPGIYWANISNTCGQSFTDTFRLNIAPSVIPGININTIPPTILCKGTPITFITNQTAAGAYPAYQWYRNGTLISGATTPAYTDAALDDQDTITVALYSSEACPLTQPTISNKVGVKVSPVVYPAVGIMASPSGNISPGSEVTFTAFATDGGAQARYSWLVNGRAVPGSYTNSYRTAGLHDGDVVQVRLESSEPCPQPALVYSNSITVHTSAAGIVSIGKGTIAIYPNPVTDHLSIDISELPAEASLYLFDALGRTVIRVLSIDNFHQEVKMQALPSGIYTYNLVMDGQVYRGKIVKQ